MDDITLSTELLWIQPKTWKKMCNLMTKTPLVPWCVHAHRWPSLGCASESIWGRNLRGKQLCKIVSSNKSDSDFSYSTEKHIWIWNWYIAFSDNSKIAQIRNYICFPMHIFINSDLTIFKLWHSCEVSWWNAFFLHSKPFYMKGLYPSHSLPRF